MPEQLYSEERVDTRARNVSLPDFLISAPNSRQWRMRILMVVARHFPFAGGTETHVHEVSKRIAAAGHSVEVLTTDLTGNLPREEFASGVRIVRVSAWPKQSDYYFAPGVISMIDRGSWDLIHIQGYHTLVAPVAMAAALKRRIPFVLTFHSGGHSSRLRNAIRGVQRAVLRPLVRHAALLIGVSQFEVDFFSSTMGLSRDRFVVIPNGAQLTAASGSVARFPERRLILSVGRLERYKGHHRAIEAFPAVLKRYPDAHLMIIGHGPYEQVLRRLIAERRLQASVTIESIPPDNRERLASLLSEAALVVLLSDYEAHPVAVAEALSLGRRVLVNNTSGLKEIADRGLARATRPDATASEVAEAMLEELSSQSPTRGIELASWDECAHSILESYKEVVARSRRGKG
jgi:glycosyltransferase involved in cell wall biosynthesis